MPRHTFTNTAKAIEENDSSSRVTNPSQFKIGDTLWRIDPEKSEPVKQGTIINLQFNYLQNIRPDYGPALRVVIRSPAPWNEEEDRILQPDNGKGIESKKQYFVTSPNNYLK